MTMQEDQGAQMGAERWLRAYYFLRAAVSVVWVGAVFTVGARSPMIAAGLLLAYPAWDALANLVDASRSGGLERNPTQMINLLVSLATTIAVGFALTKGMNLVLGVFGGWAILSGLLQLATAIRRWKRAGAQWAMVLSGAQSALAGAFFIIQARGSAPASIATIGGYAAVGAIYFLVSAVWLSVKLMRRKVG